MSELICVMCDYKTKRKDNYKRHLKSKLHKKRMEKGDEVIGRPVENEETEVEVIELLGNKTTIEEPKYYVKCELCNINFIDRESAVNHVDSEEHGKNKKIFIDEILKLNLCEEELKKAVDKSGFKLL